MKTSICSRIGVGIAFLLLATFPAARAQDEANAAREQVQSYFESNEITKAVATLAEASEKYPKDRVIGGMLYAAVRDHVWHKPQTLPVRHDGPVKALAFSPDSSTLASGSAKGEVLLSTTESLDEEEAAAKRVTLQAGSEILGLAFSKDGQRLAVAAKSGALKLFEMTGAKEVFAAPQLAGEVTAFAKAANADLVAIGTKTGAIQVIDIGAGKVIASLQSAGGEVRSLALSRTGAKLAAAGVDGIARLWNTEKGESIGTGVRRQRAILSVDFSYDDRYVLTGGEDGNARLSEPDSGIQVMPEMPCGAIIRKVSVSPDGSMIATVLDDWTVLFWDAFSGKKLPFNIREDAAFNDFVWFRAGLRGATASEANHASLWTVYNATRRGEVIPHDGPVTCLATSKDSKLLATASADGTARVWRTDGGMPLVTVRNHYARARTAFYSQDGEHLVTASEDHTALHWLSGHVRPFGPAMEHAGKVTCAVFDSDAKRILSCDDSGVAQLWNASNGHPDGAPFRHQGPVRWVDFHPDGKRFVSVSGALASIWSVDDHTKPLATISHPGGGKSILYCARFSPDGKWLVTASSDGTAQIWNAATYQPTGVKIERHFPVLCVRFSPDGSRLVVAGEDAHAAVYDTATWQPVGVPVLAPGPVFSAAFTGDNQFMIVSSLLLDAVQFYEVSTGRPLGQGLTLPTQMTCADYLVRDEVVVVACEDGTVRALGAPFVLQDTPPWMRAFTESLIGLRKTGPDSFERVEAHIDQLRNYVSSAARSTNYDFPKLVRWKMTAGNLRNGMPRFTSTLATNIEQRVDERSVDALFECYEAVSGDALILSALSLYLPNPRQGEYLADIVLAMPNAEPLARCFAAGTLINSGRKWEAETVLEGALAQAPEDPRVLRRVAKLDARLLNKRRAYELFEKSLRLEPNDAETRRTYAWVLYSFNEPAKAALQFHLAEELTGKMNDDVVAGLCLCAAAQKNASEAASAYQRLIEIDQAWKDPAHLVSLRGWTQRQLTELEKVRQTLLSKK